MLSVHPHACGEHRIMSRLRSRRVGSSPRMWGTHGCQKDHSYQARFIPTHVGNTIWLNDGLLMIAVHPHACGEHVFGGLSCWLESGSSPRMWGTHSNRSPQIPQYRFIPTHVGNTCGQHLVSRLASVHPHACGEHGRRRRRYGPRRGSSPRMWGTRAKFALSWVYFRFIPTHVGNTGAGG